MISGAIRKMQTQHNTPVQYHLPLGDELVDMNALIGKHLNLEYQGEIHCIHCQRKTNKSFNQGFCFPCFRSLAQCDRCIVSPELCHYAQGTCREPEWGDEHCMQTHVVYLANSSGLKVGITRLSQVPTRWMDQGAIQALPILHVDTRLHSGLVEVILKQHTADRTNWRKMLKNDVEPIDLAASAEALLAQTEADIASLNEQGVEVKRCDSNEVYQFEYPVLVYPDKVSSLSFDKAPIVQGVLQGIKGQYLILDTGVINMRKFAGYQVSLKVKG